MTKNYNVMLSLCELPQDLAEPIYASWISALHDVRKTPSIILGNERYQFCCGYVQALQDSGLFEPRLCPFLSVQVQEIWMETLAALDQEGLCCELAFMRMPCAS